MLPARKMIAVVQRVPALQFSVDGEHPSEGCGGVRGGRHDHCSASVCLGASGHQGHYDRRGSLPNVRTLELARGGCAPLRTPGVSRRCRSNGRTGAPLLDPRAGVLLAERRPVVVAAHVMWADHAAFGQAEAHRLRNAWRGARRT